MEFEKLKKLGFGLMRLPMKEGFIDLETTQTMVDRFMAEGFQYFDTAWAYPGSEEAIGKTLVANYPRESYWLTTKNACWKQEVTDAETARRQLYDSLERTGAGYFDLYLLHNMGSGREKAFDRFGMWEFLKEKKEEGVIRHIGFSAHTSPELIDELLSRHPETEFVQLQINYADWNDPTIRSGACYETVLRHGKKVLVMEPVKGGLLASPPEPVAKIFAAADAGRTPSSWALRFAADLPGVGMVLSGMSAPEQMEDNLRTFRDFQSLEASEKAVLERAAAEFEKMPLIPCTSCDYCGSVCPERIGISGAFQALNIERLFHDRNAARGRAGFNILAQGKKLPEECVGCGACEAVCPQGLPVRELLKEFTAKIDMG